MSKDNQILEDLTSKEYEHGWSVNMEADEAPIGLNEGIIRWISTKKEEPQWLLEWRLKAYKTWENMTEPIWANVHYPKIDLQSLIFYSAPKQAKKTKNLDEVDPQLLEINKRLGISLNEQKRLEELFFVLSAKP
jgi:Fe-S cluster assembly protein SufB